MNVFIRHQCRRIHECNGRTIFVLIVAAFCFFNIYRSTTLSNHHFASSHEYFRRESADAASGSERRRRSSPTGNYFPPDVADKRGGGDRPEVSRLDQIRGIHAEEYPQYNVTLKDGTSRAVPVWQRRLKARNSSAEYDEDLIGPYYFLTELLQVRLYANDKARWTVRELKQWLHYMFLVGVEHVYVCDHYADPSERLYRRLTHYIDAGLLTYIPWSGVGRDPMSAQIRCYQRVVDRFRRRHRWQIAVDMDEYPFSPNDTAENFLVRFLESLPDDVSEVNLPNYLMLGRGDRSSTRTVIQRIARMTPRPANDLVKPIYRPSRVRGANVHHNHLESGSRLTPHPQQLRMLHYWGARGQNWGPDTPHILATTEPMTEMRDAWTERLENSLLVFGESDAFSNETGP